jgi:hypothetical protein
MDIVAEPIPSGDVYLVRQVFQHLSNDDITHVLHKLQGSPCVIVTEGQPSKLSGPKNRDKTAGGNTRFDTATGSGSGVYLDEPPFSLNLQELCRVEIAGTERIITWRVVQQEHTTERRS